MDGPIINPGKAAQRELLKRWLIEFMKAGRVPAVRVIELTVAAGHARSTLFRAKTELGIRSERDGFGRGSKCYWRLPDSSGDI